MRRRYAEQADAATRPQTSKYLGFRETPPCEFRMPRQKDHCHTEGAAPNLRILVSQTQVNAVWVNEESSSLQIKAFWRHLRGGTVACVLGHGTPNASVLQALRLHPSVLMLVARCCSSMEPRVQAWMVQRRPIHRGAACVGAMPCAPRSGSWPAVRCSPDRGTKPLRSSTVAHPRRERSARQTPQSS